MRIKKNYSRTIEPDQKFNSLLVAKLINRSMIGGKKNIAAKQVYQALDVVAKQTKKTQVQVMEELVEVVAPKMEVRSRRVGGASYQVPMPVKAHRASSLAVRWLVIEANKRPNAKYHSFGEKLAAEMMDAFNQEGGAIAKRNNAHKMADANKAFAHFRW
ncbi:MAG TPA: 30S ribosomal protein S7 [Candidatus Woesebacteria bacterium]|nr:30S ribosomal protein S7 [Candidatus Woesebacteria bacterium]